jgi:peptidoglycan/xylan/chitin deacetylase (PgdA/CDA1 family)
LVNNYHVVSLEEAIRLLETGQSLRDDIFALTFDDCYKGWINYVLPECQRLEIPYAIFVATGPVDSGRPLFYDGLIFLAENTWRKVIDLSAWGLGVFLLDTSNSTARFVENVHEYWRGKSVKDRNLFFQELSEYLEISLNFEKFNDIILDWDDVREMDTHGVTIGAHSVSHICLRDLPEAECFAEIKQSKQRLEEELGHSVIFFAYPYGAHDYYERDTIRIVAAAGFRYAFTLDLDVSDSNQLLPFEIGRRGVSRGMFTDPDGDFHEPLLATELCGLGDLFFLRIFMRRRRLETPAYE